MGDFYNYTLPAFPGGLNLIDSIDNLPETDCLELLNLWPIGSRLVLRKGIEESWLTDADEAVKTLANLILADGTEKLVAAFNEKLAIQNSATYTSIVGATTPTVNEWQYTVFNNVLYLVNGTDTPQIYNGTGNCSDAAFTGTTQANFIFVFAHKERLYFIPKNSASVWYTNNTKAVSGALTEFPFGYQFKRGGFLVMGGSTTKQSGNLQQDILFALSSQGELLLYQGSFPGDTTFTIIARYYIGKPLGRRAYVYVENDIWFLTSRGIVPLSILLGSTTSVAANSISKKINPLLKEAAKNIPFSYLYSAKYSELDNMVFINFPITVTDTRQLAINVETGSWTVYKYSVTGAVLSMEISGDHPYFGGNNGKVYLGEEGYNDDEEEIEFLARGGFNFFGKRGMFKVFKDIRPIIKTQSESINLYLDMDTDFQRVSEYNTITTPSPDPTMSSPWDSTLWDTGFWSTEDRYLFDRYGLARQGHCGALRVKGSIIDALLEFNAFEIRFEEGTQV